jgi:hypothetical protein
MMLEDGLVIGREEILRPPPRPSRSITASMVMSPILICFMFPPANLAGADRNR